MERLIVDKPKHCERIVLTQTFHKVTFTYLALSILKRLINKLFFFFSFLILNVSGFVFRLWVLREILKATRNCRHGTRLSCVLLVNKLLVEQS